MTFHDNFFPILWQLFVIFELEPTSKKDVYRIINHCGVYQKAGHVLAFTNKNLRLVPRNKCADHGARWLIEKSPNDSERYRIVNTQDPTDVRYMFV